MKETGWCMHFCGQMKLVVLLFDLLSIKKIKDVQFFQYLPLPHKG